MQWVPEIAWLCLSLWLALQLALGGQIRYVGAGDPLYYLPFFDSSGFFAEVPWVLLFLIMLGLNLVFLLALVISSSLRYRGIRLLVCLGSFACLLLGAAAIESRSFDFRERGMRAVAEWAEPIVSRLSAPGGAADDAEKLTELLHSLGTFDLRGHPELPLHLVALQDGEPSVILVSSSEGGTTFVDLVKRRIQLTREQPNFAVGVCFQFGWGDAAWIWTDTARGGSGESADGWAWVDNGD